ncbi:LysE family translocator [Acidiphilium acidophilum]|uniref:LysE family translocator n=1 Tax=Acidiphilium acidophilum TaxID=76588 RepID=A0AAW9DM78_ACIAO|nr:LysE family translocator [Acidiphilium acidophilum]MDX5929820.1 LysE family translocator [Acidiphilium acidophilum]
MPDPHLYFGFVATVTVLMLLPGPNVGLIVANSIRYGIGYGLLTVAGTTAAMAVQLALTGLGLSTLLAGLGAWFAWVRWIGAAYLIYLGIRAWFAPPLAPGAPAATRSTPRAILGRAVLVSLTNPKTLMFYGALLPQFITGSGVAHQMLVLALTALAIALVIDSLWCLAAHRLRLRLSGRWANRLSGGVLAGAGLGLALARVRR